MTDPRASRNSVQSGSVHALVLLGGAAPTRAGLDASWPGWDAGADEVIAADAGLAIGPGLGLEPTLLVGDLDSLDPSLAAAAEAAGLPVRRFPVAKDETDAELALLESVAHGATRITVLGWSGGARLDHALANTWLLAHPALAEADVVLLDATCRVTLLQAPATDGGPAVRHLPGPTGAIVSLLPFGGDADGVTTRGLRYPLDDEVLVTGPARGVSNVRDAADASVTLRRGRLLVVEIALAESGLSSPS